MPPQGHALKDDPVRLWETSASFFFGQLLDLRSWTMVEARSAREPEGQGPAPALVGYQYFKEKYMKTVISIIIALSKLVSGSKLAEFFRDFARIAVGGAYA